MDNILYLLPAMLFLLVICICYLSNAGFHHITFKGRFGPTSAEFIAERRVKRLSHRRQLDRASNKDVAKSQDSST